MFWAPKKFVKFDDVKMKCSTALIANNSMSMQQLLNNYIRLILPVFIVQLLNPVFTFVRLLSGVLFWKTAYSTHAVKSVIPEKNFV